MHNDLNKLVCSIWEIALLEVQSWQITRTKFMCGEKYSILYFMNNLKLNLPDQ